MQTTTKHKAIAPPAIATMTSRTVNKTTLKENS